MTRVETLQGRRAPIFARVVAWFSRRKYGREMDPLGVYAHSPRMLLGYSMYELASAAAKPEDFSWFFGTEKGRRVGTRAGS